MILLGSAECVRKQIDRLSGVLKCDCGLTDRQRIVCQRGQNDVATDFLQRGTQDTKRPPSNNTSSKCGFLSAGRRKKRPQSDMSAAFLFVWNFICLICCFWFVFRPDRTLFV